MDDKDVAIIETKLDILIEDFQSFKRAQLIYNEERRTHGAEEDVVQAKILTTQKWHTTIGGFMMIAIVWLVTKEVVG